MRILIITNLYPPQYLGGYELLCYQVAEYLMAQGHQVEVLTSDFMSEGELEKGVSRSLKIFQDFRKTFRDSLGFRMKMPGIDKYNQAEAQRKVSQFKPDIIFMWSQRRLTLGPALAAERSGIPCVCTMNDEWLGFYEPVKFKWKLGRLLRYLCQEVCFPTTTTADVKLKNSFSVSCFTRDAIMAVVQSFTSEDVIYQGIELKSFPYRGLKEELGSPVKLLYVGQLLESKGVSNLVLALALLKSKGDFVLTIVGTGPASYMSRLEEECAELKSNIEFMGKVPIDQISELYRAHDIFIFPSIGNEAFGLTHIEAMASGLPVISTLNGGQREFLKDGINCLTFRAGDGKQLVSKIEKMVYDTHLRLEIIEAGRREVETNFSTERYFEEIHQYLQKAAVE